MVREGHLKRELQIFAAPNVESVVVSANLFKKFLVN